MTPLDKDIAVLEFLEAEHKSLLSKIEDRDNDKWNFEELNRRYYYIGGLIHNVKHGAPQ